MATIRKVKLENIKHLYGKTNWSYLKTQSDNEIKSASLTDPDAQELTGYALLQLKKVE